MKDDANNIICMYPRDIGKPDNDVVIEIIDEDSDEDCEDLIYESPFRPRTSHRNANVGGEEQLLHSRTTATKHEETAKKQPGHCSNSHENDDEHDDIVEYPACSDHDDDEVHFLHCHRQSNYVSTDEALKCLSSNKTNASFNTFKIEKEERTKNKIISESAKQEKLTNRHDYYKNDNYQPSKITHNKAKTNQITNFFAAKSKKVEKNENNIAMNVLFAADVGWKERERQRNHNIIAASMNNNHNTTFSYVSRNHCVKNRRNDILGGSGVGAGHFTFTNNRNVSNSNDNDVDTLQINHHNREITIRNQNASSKARSTDNNSNSRKKPSTTNKKASSQPTKSTKRKTSKRRRKWGGKYKRNNCNKSSNNKWSAREKNSHPYNQSLIHSQDPQLKNIGGAKITF